MKKIYANSKGWINSIRCIDGVCHYHYYKSKLIGQTFIHNDNTKRQKIFNEKLWRKYKINKLLEK
jgi:hypothetical protein